VPDLRGPGTATTSRPLVRLSAAAGESLYLNHVVMCEVNWVLTRAYDYDRLELAEAIEKILTAAQFEFEDKNSLWQALAGFKQFSADFADCLIGAKNVAAGCASTLTF
jgi:predicted nucleic-acid-binding protein